jgi:hypothetical protein
MAIGAISPFRATGTVGIATGVSSVAAPLAGGGETVVVTNPTNALAYVRFGSDSGISATSQDMPVLPGGRVILSINSLITHAAAVLASGSGTVLLTRGDGSIV